MPGVLKTMNICRAGGRRGSSLIINKGEKS